MSSTFRVGIFGAGAIGGFVGGRLAASGCEVTLVGRPRVIDPIREHGLTLEDLDGRTRRATTLRCATDAEALRDCDVVIVTTKSAGTREAAIAVRESTRADVPVVSLQNGVEGPVILKEVLGASRGFGGMIAYNVVFRDATTLRRATSGPIVIERGVDRLLAALKTAELDAHDTSEIGRVLWSKMLFNLNNALNALSGLPLRTQLRDRGYRRLMATMMREGMAVMRAQHMRPMRFGMMYPPLAALVLPSPDFVFQRAAAAMLKIDPEARSSMAEDLALHRPTEIDALNGVVVRRGHELGVPTPLNERVVAAIRRAEVANVGSPHLSPDAIAR